MRHIDFENLEKWVKRLTRDDFDNLKKAYTTKEIEMWPELEFDWYEEIKTGDYFLVDTSGHIQIVKKTVRKFKTESGRLVAFKEIKKLKKNENPCVNGCWAVPRMFILGGIK